MTKIPILHVEDEENDLFILQQAFKRAGIANPIQVAVDGQAAVYYLSGVGPYADRQKHPLPNLVLLDLKVPKLDGFEVLAWIRQQPALRGLVVIALSGSVLPQDIDRAYQLGVNSYIAKPGDLGQVMEVAVHLQGWWLRHNQFARVGTVDGAAPLPPPASPSRHLRTISASLLGG
jgi:CheY-like chemotaxis protein